MNLIMCAVSFSLIVMAAKTTHAYPISDHYDGEIFFNPEGPISKGFLDLLKWQFEGGRQPWPAWVENKAQPKIASPNAGGAQGQVAPNEVRITLINHVTELIQFQNLNVLTDPVYAERASPFQWIGPRRHRAPGLAFEALPRIDVVLVSHNHYDHMDLVALKRLHATFHPLFLVPLANGKLLAEAGIGNVVELDWWQVHELAERNARITLVPAQHWSSRTPWDRNRALWGGFVIDSSGVKVYFAGDTGYNGVFRKIKEHIGAVDVSLVPIGAYEPRWFMREQHMNPDDAVRAHRDLGPRLSIGMHYGCFQLTNEAIDDPIKDLQTALAKYGVPPSEFAAPETGETIIYRKPRD